VFQAPHPEKRVLAELPAQLRALDLDLVGRDEGLGEHAKVPGRVGIQDIGADVVEILLRGEVLVGAHALLAGQEDEPVGVAAVVVVLGTRRGGSKHRDDGCKDNRPRSRAKVV